MSTIYGDPDLNPTLSDNQHAKSQTLVQPDTLPPTTLVGDVDRMIDDAMGGNDTLTGANFVLPPSGGEKLSLLVGDAKEFMLGSAQGGNDTITGASNGGDGILHNVLFGDAVMFMRQSSQGGNDILIGGNSIEDIISGAHGKVINGLIGDVALMGDFSQGGNDTVIGGNNDNGTSMENRLRGDAETMRESSQGGNDTVIGGNNNHGGLSPVTNLLIGDADTMSGSAKGGNDTLVAGTASASSAGVMNDMWGDGKLSEGATGGQDTFIFKDDVKAGQTVGTQNKIEDFSQSQHDVIEFVGVFDGAKHIHSFKQLDINQSGGDTVIHAGADTVTLVGFTGTLTADDFAFA